MYKATILIIMNIFNIIFFYVSELIPTRIEALFLLNIILISMTIVMDELNNTKDKEGAK